MSTVENRKVKQQPAAKSMASLVFEQFCEHRLALFSIFVIAFFVIVALSADGIAYMMGLDPYAQDILNRYGEWSAQNWLGTDEAGRDVFIRLIYGARVSLLVAFLVAFTSMIIGVVVGAVAGYFGGLLDTILMRVVDSLLALPIIPVLIILASIDLNSIPGLSYFLGGENASIAKMVFILMSFSWMIQARLVRGEILSIKEREFVLAAQTSGMSHFGVILKEVIPNVLTPVTVAVTLNVGNSILFESALSFLGLGIQPPTSTWGSMLNNAQEVIYSAPSQAIFPGILISITVVCFNFLGDGLQAALDPKGIKR